MQGLCNYKYEVEIDLEKLVDKIAALLPGDVDTLRIDEDYVLHIAGRDICAYDEEPGAFDLIGSVQDIDLGNRIEQILHSADPKDFRTMVTAITE